MDCPNCGEKELWRDSADVGIGTIYGPYGCPCGWSEDDKYNQLLGNGGAQSNGAYTDVYGGLYPNENTFAVAYHALSKLQKGDLR